MVIINHAVLVYDTDPHHTDDDTDSLEVTADTPPLLGPAPQDATRGDGQACHDRRGTRCLEGKGGVGKG